MANTSKQFVWQTLFAGIVAAVVCLSMILLDNDNGMFLYVLVVVPVISFVALLTLAIRKLREQRIATIAMLITYWIVTGALFINYDRLRPTLRWSLWAQHYKAEVSAQPESQHGILKHIEWDGWGGLGAGDTVAYLVFDPTDSLSTAADKHLSGKFDGLPCEVPKVNRLERNWYSVVFYTDTDWEHCR